MRQAIARRLRNGSRHAATFDGQFQLCASFLAAVAFQVIARACHAPGCVLGAGTVAEIVIAAVGLPALAVLLNRTNGPRPDARR